MIRNTIDVKNEFQARLAIKTLDEQFLRLIEEGAKCPPFSAKQILKTAKTIYNIDGHGSSEYEKDHTVRPGQMKVLGVLASEPAGKPLAQCQFGQAIVILDAGNEDQEVRSRRKFIVLSKESTCRAGGFGSNL